VSVKVASEPVLSKQNFKSELKEKAIHFHCMPIAQSLLRTLQWLIKLSLSSQTLGISNTLNVKRNLLFPQYSIKKKKKNTTTTSSPHIRAMKSPHCIHWEN